MVIAVFMLSPEQCRAARGWLGWSQEDLSKRANVGLSTVKDFEGGKRSPMRNNLEAIRAALETAGIRFTYMDNGRPLGIAGGLPHEGEQHGASR